MNLLLSPHDDDSVLFAAFTCMREKPKVAVILDSWLQPNRGERGCSAQERAEETARAHAIIGGEIVRCGLRDDKATEDEIVQSLKGIGNFDRIYAPTVDADGNVHHNMVGRAALRLYGPRVQQYPTYTKTELYKRGSYEVIPTTRELELKQMAMECFESQLRINLPHFKAVQGKSEWLIADDVKVQLGCGRDKWPGWVNIDQVGGDIQADLRKGIPLPDNWVDKIYSQDFLEHLPPEAGVPMMNEIWRVLRPDGIMEHLMPNAGSRNDYGSPSHLSHWNLQTFEHFDRDSYRWEKDRHYEGFIGAFKKQLAEFVNWQVEEDGIRRAQGIHVVYAAVK